jgi:cell fate regulator YaaT (PSP1 superfamily)
MGTLAEVRFKGNRKGFFTWDQADALSAGQSVIVSVERGQDLGTVSAFGPLAERKCGTGCAGCALGQPREPDGAVLRHASPEDAHLAGELRRAEDDVRRKVMERVIQHRLAMKVSDAEWQWDRKRLTVYFTAEQRVDFRALVRDLASLFRTRIELRQIGARDEAKRLEGVGRCGREYCCSSWLPELRPVSLALAKDQRLSLNPSQISGGCGRLLCCLRYEHDFYVASRKRFPKEGKLVTTAHGAENVLAVDIFRERILLKAEDGRSRTLNLVELKAEMAGVTPPPREAPPQAPAALVTFDEGSSTVSPEEAIASVTPATPPKRRRRGRRGSGRNRRPAEGPRDRPGDDRTPPPDGEPPEPPGEPGG